eukprot:scpid85419/ scgid24767/ 
MKASEADDAGDSASESSPPAPIGEDTADGVARTTESTAYRAALCECRSLLETAGDCVASALLSRAASFASARRLVYSILDERNSEKLQSEIQNTPSAGESAAETQLHRYQKRIEDSVTYGREEREPVEVFRDDVERAKEHVGACVERSFELADVLHTRIADAQRNHTESLGTGILHVATAWARYNLLASVDVDPLISLKGTTADISLVGKSMTSWWNRLCTSRAESEKSKKGLQLHSESEAVQKSLQELKDDQSRVRQLISDLEKSLDVLKQRQDGSHYDPHHVQEAFEDLWDRARQHKAWLTESRSASSAA